MISICSIIETKHETSVGMLEMRRITTCRPLTGSTTAPWPGPWWPAAGRGWGWPTSSSQNKFSIKWFSLFYFSTATIKLFAVLLFSQTIFNQVFFQSSQRKYHHLQYKSNIYKILLVRSKAPMSLEIALNCNLYTTILFWRQDTFFTNFLPPVRIIYFEKPG